jgi:hypothetical protein
MKLSHEFKEDVTMTRLKVTWTLDLLAKFSILLRFPRIDVLLR